MDTYFYDSFGQYCIKWQDKNGNTWTATAEEVEVFGKECFEMDPDDPEIIKWNEEHPFTF